MFNRSFRTLSVLFVIFLGLGCSTGDVRYYRLRPLISDSFFYAYDSSKSNVTIGVGPISVAGYLRKPQIAESTGPYELRYAKHQHWSDDIEVLVADTVANNLRPLLKTDRISFFPFQSQKPQYRVALEIIRFDGGPNGPCTVEVRWQVTGWGTDGKAPIRRSVIEEMPEEHNYNGVAAAFSKAIGRISIEIAVEVQRVHSEMVTG